jgi:chemotaxis protein methyltransferase CheR
VTKFEALGQGNDPLRLSAAGFARIADYINSELGIKMPESKITLIQSRLVRRVRDLGLESVEEYGEYFFTSASAEERTHFINAVTTNKTDFFREPEHFDFLARVAIPSIDRGSDAGGDGRLNVWSAGCSSGEEPYTLAMVLSEHAYRFGARDFALLGTDVSTNVLDRARSGIYDEAQIAPVPAELRKKYLRRGKDDRLLMARVIPELRQKVSFHQLNFMDADYRIKNKFDVIFFRNVMIYFDKATQEAVIQKICRNLNPGGYLFVGHSESLAGLSVPVQAVKNSVFRKPR